MRHWKALALNCARATRTCTWAPNARRQTWNALKCSAVRVLRVLTSTMSVMTAARSARQHYFSSEPRAAVAMCTHPRHTALSSLLSHGNSREEFAATSANTWVRQNSRSTAQVSMAIFVQVYYGLLIVNASV